MLQSDDETFFFFIYDIYEILGEGQHLEQPNVERPIVRNFEISHIKRTKDELFYSFKFLINFFYICFNYSNTQNIR